MISRHLFTLLPPWIVGALAARWWMTFDPATLAVAGVAAMVELTLWYQRLARAGVRKAMLAGDPMGAQLERWLLTHPVPVVVALAVGGVLIYLGRAAWAVGSFLWWAIGFPTVLVNRQRYQRAQALRQAAMAQRIIEGAQSQAHVAAGASLKAKALESAGRALGLDAAPARPVHVLEPVERSFDSLEELPAPAAREIASVAIVHGLVSTHPDGSHTFEPMAVTPAEVDR